MLQECQDSDLAERLQLVYQEVQRLTRNLNDLLASARSSTVSSQTIQVKQALEDLLRLLKYQAQESISFNYEVADDLQVFLPENEFRQVLLNLLLNSIQAIGSGSGTVSIVARREAERLLLTVSDTGHGFDADFLRHGIRPFVSLKDGGTGLGLSMVQRFVKDHQGQLKLENDAAGHASVTLNLAVV
jgi:signal transduction histidine kinase